MRLEPGVARSLLLKVLLAVLLVGVHAATTRAYDWNCISQQQWCNLDTGCNGTGIAWDPNTCQIWCYINEGQELSGYANCYRQIPD